jgi:hypothetical protein
MFYLRTVLKCILSLQGAFRLASKSRWLEPEVKLSRLQHPELQIRYYTLTFHFECYI